MTGGPRTPRRTVILRLRLDVIVSGRDRKDALRKVTAPRDSVLRWDETLVRDAEGWVNPAYLIEDQTETACTVQVRPKRRRVT